jgi:hypothetical protein
LDSFPDIRRQLRLVALMTLAVFAAFGIHVALGSAFEVRTVGAMMLRSIVWIAIAEVPIRSKSNNCPDRLLV